MVVLDCPVFAGGRPAPRSPAQHRYNSGSMTARLVPVLQALTLVAAVSLVEGLAGAQVSESGHDRLFPPQDLGLLEGPDRAVWQRPDQIMDVLGIADGSAVADIGAGSGWFTIKLARRIGPRGRVYAQDVQREMLDAIRRRVSREGLQNVETRLGAGTLPNLPVGALDAVLVVDAYQEVNAEDRVAFLKNLARALKPGGRIGIVNYKPGKGGPGPALRVDRANVEADAGAAGLRVEARENLPYQYLLVLGK